MTHPSEFKGKYIIQGKIHCLTGLHIGGSDTGIEIGGLDNPVIKDPLTDLPYIPGSSLKGKLRAVTEWNLGLIGKHSKHEGYPAYECQELKKERGPETSTVDDGEETAAAQESQEEQNQTVDPALWDAAYTLARIFGPASDDETVRAQAGPTRLTVRDAFLNDRSVKELQHILGTDVFTEVKTENALDRVTSEATPRPIERVPADTEFDFTLILDVYLDKDKELLRTLFAAMALLEDTALGGGGSRGHGQIEFHDLQVVWRSKEYYTDGQVEQHITAAQGKNVRTLAATFQKGDW
jgi:CRISPR-associated protein Csm3